MKKRIKKSKFAGFKLVPETSGKIVSGVYIKEDNSEIIIDFAWGGKLKFMPLPENYAKGN